MNPHFTDEPKLQRNKVISYGPIAMVASRKKDWQQKFSGCQSSMAVEIRSLARWAGGLARPLLKPAPHASIRAQSLPGRRKAAHIRPHIGTNTSSTAGLLPASISLCLLLRTLHTNSAFRPGGWLRKPQSIRSGQFSLKCYSTKSQF